MQKDRGLYYTPAIVKVLQLLSSSTDLPTKKAKSLIPLGVDQQRDSEIEVKEGLVKLDKDSCRNTEYITIPYSNDIQDGCLISSSSTYL